MVFKYYPFYGDIKSALDWETRMKLSEMTLIESIEKKGSLRLKN